MEMIMDKRSKIINFLETLLIKEAVETFERKKNRNLSEEEKSDITNNWYLHSSVYTRMWLNYLTDANLEKVLAKKLNEQNINDGINELTGKM
jgi:hypothetical protein